MPDTAHTLLSRNILPRRLQRSQQATTLRSVWQDKIAPRRERAASPQPVSSQKVTRTRQTSTNISRSQNQFRKHSRKRKTVPLVIWLSPSEKADVRRLAEQEGLSLSQTGRTFVVEGIRQKLHTRYAVLIQPIIETTIRNELRRYFSRMILFLARITMTLDVMKGLIKWLCRRLAGATKEQVDSVEVRSRTDARVNLIKRTPQLESITEELEKTLMEGIV